MSLAKLNARDVAKDFGMQAKAITAILTEHTKEAASPTKVLTDRELSIVFEHLTQNNQVDSIESIYADVYHEPAKAAAPAKGEPEAKPAAGKESAPAPQPQPQGQDKAAPAPQKEQPKSAPAKPASRTPEKKVVDTRKGGGVNLEKYDQRLEDLAPDKANRMQTGKQKFQNRGSKNRGQSFGNKRKQEEQDRMRRLQLEIAKKTPLTVKIPDEIGVGELASRMKKTGAEVVKCLIRNGVMASLSDVIDYDTAALVAMELGCKVEKEVIVTIEERLIDTAEDKEEDLEYRAPVVVVMGHVDHGKTSLLDHIRNANVVSGEAGGITQHIGAYQVEVNGKPITFLDTPGHEAFTAMRARGAQVTDVIVLVVAADDGVMPQTIEAINHAKAAEVPIVVAVNKIDKPGANPDRVRQELTEYGVIPEEWGGSNMFVEVSAKKKLHIDDLLETIILQADVLELKANPDAEASGFVIEANLDKGRGPVATVLIQRGTLHTGDVVVAGTSYGRVRALVNPRGEHVNEAKPADPVEILGLNSVPTAGDEFRVFEDERDARKLAEERALRARLAAQETKSHMSLDDLFSRIEEGKQTDLNLIVKADVQGSIEALRDAFDKMDQSEVRINIVHSAVGGITETDVTLAAASDAIIIGFNVRPTGKSRTQAEKEKVDIRLYRVIYQAIEDINAARVGLLSPDIVEVDTGIAEVRDTFKVPKVGTIAGCYIIEGEINRDDKVRIVRDGTVIFEGHMASLRRFKDDVKSVKQGYECGIGIEKFQDLKVGDTIEGYQVKEVERTE